MLQGVFDWEVICSVHIAKYWFQSMVKQYIHTHINHLPAVGIDVVSQREYT